MKFWKFWFVETIGCYSPIEKMYVVCADWYRRMPNYFCGDVHTGMDTIWSE